VSASVSRRRILVLAVPALGSLAADPVLSLVDTAFVGRLGAEPLAALGVDAAIFGFAFALFNFLAYATTPLVAQARGRGEIVESGRVVQRALVLAVGIGVLSTAVMVVGARTLVGLMGAGSEFADAAVSYLTIRSFALPALLIITAANGAYRGFQDTRTPLLVTLAVNGLNIALDPLLMFDFGFGLGLEGAAWATLIAQWIGGLVFLWLLTGTARRESWPTARVHFGELRAFLGIGSVLILRTGLLVLSLSIATSVAARIGTLDVAAHQVVSQIWFFLAMVIDALAIAAQALVAELSGRGDIDGARALSTRLLRWGGVAGIGLTVGLLAVGSVISTGFTDDPGVSSRILKVVPIAAGMQPLAALVFVLDGVFLAVLAIKKLAWSTAAGFAATVIVLALTLANDWGLAGVWWAITAMIVARLIVLGRYYSSASTWSSS
jgi:MATE family multidrug resistance protein